jgi:hypothetical protein
MTNISTYAHDLFIVMFSPDLVSPSHTPCNVPQTYPKQIVFDLDGTLWHPGINCFSHLVRLISSKKAERDIGLFRDVLPAMSACQREGNRVQGLAQLHYVNLAEN